MFELAVSNIQHLNSNQEDFFAFVFFFALNYTKVWSNFNALTLASPILNSGIYKNELIVWVEVSTSPQKHPTPYFLSSPFQIFQAPFLGNSPIILIFCEPPSPNNYWTPIILPFFVVNTILSFKSN